MSPSERQCRSTHQTAQRSFHGVALRRRGVTSFHGVALRRRGVTLVKTPPDDDRERSFRITLLGTARCAVDILCYIAIMFSQDLFLFFICVLGESFIYLAEV